MAVGSTQLLAEMNTSDTYCGAGGGGGGKEGGGFLIRLVYF